jgi:hypothetical protein
MHAASSDGFAFFVECASQYYAMVIQNGKPFLNR